MTTGRINQIATQQRAERTQPTTTRFSPHEERPRADEERLLALNGVCTPLVFQRLSFFKPRRKLRTRRYGRNPPLHDCRFLCHVFRTVNLELRQAENLPGSSNTQVHLLCHKPSARPSLRRARLSRSHAKASPADRLSHNQSTSRLRRRFRPARR